MNVYLGLGSNQGNKKVLIEKAIDRLNSVGEVIAVSPLYETEPFGIEDQPTFLNAVCLIETDLEPDLLLEQLLDIEGRLGRKRTVKNGPRTIDIDILLYGDKIIDEVDLQIPHPGMHERWCVLKPLVDIAPDVIHPLFHKTIKDLLLALPEHAMGRHCEE